MNKKLQRKKLLRKEIINMAKEFLTGNEVVIKAALAAKAEAFFGYPITPATEIMAGWAAAKAKSNKLLFLQAEDEMSAGFMMIGSILVGRKTFSATTGIGNVLMQDALSMAEAMEFPTVVIIGQRGGPSTGSVIYSQQEVNLTCYGGNSEGYRVVYSPANLQELYDLVIQAFNTAWKYSIPTFVLTDGYMLKTRSILNTYQPKNLIKTKRYIFKKTNRNPGKESDYVHLMNTYAIEEECYEANIKLIEKYKKVQNEVAIANSYNLNNKTKKLIIAHGLIGSAAEEAINIIGLNKRVGLFRPITLRPFPDKELRKHLNKIKEIYIFESAANQLQRLVKENLYGINIPIKHYGYPALGIEAELIAKLLK